MNDQNKAGSDRTVIVDPDTAELLTKMLAETGERMLRYFAYAHLPAKLQEMSAPFAELACKVVNKAKGSPERTVALRKLLEAKDCAVRALLEE